MKEVLELRVVNYAVTCPHCGEENEGYFGDARGEHDTCVFCEEEFYISEHADFEAY